MRKFSVLAVVAFLASCSWIQDLAHPPFEGAWTYTDPNGGTSIYTLTASRVELQIKAFMSEAELRGPLAYTDATLRWWFDEQYNPITGLWTAIPATGTYQADWLLKDERLILTIGGKSYPFSRP